jgi:hypothetical protein
MKIPKTVVCSAGSRGFCCSSLVIVCSFPEPGGGYGLQESPRALASQERTPSNPAGSSLDAAVGSFFRRLFRFRVVVLEMMARPHGERRLTALREALIGPKKKGRTLRPGPFAFASCSASSSASPPYAVIVM